MKHSTLSDRTTAFAVTNMGSEDVPAFLSDCLRKKRLSKIVIDLNHELLFGTPKERSDAQEALTKLGFV